MGNACTCETSEPDPKQLETLAAQALQARTDAELREEIDTISEECAKQMMAPGIYTKFGFQGGFVGSFAKVESFHGGLAKLLGEPPDADAIAKMILEHCEVGRGGSQMPPL
jgi:hypothetical protein